METTLTIQDCSERLMKYIYRYDEDKELIVIAAKSLSGAYSVLEDDKLLYMGPSEAAVYNIVSGKIGEDTMDKLHSTI